MQLCLCCLGRLKCVTVYVCGVVFECVTVVVCWLVGGLKCVTVFCVCVFKGAKMCICVRVVGEGVKVCNCVLVGGVKCVTVLVVWEGANVRNCVRVLRVDKVCNSLCVWTGKG